MILPRKMLLVGCLIIGAPLLTGNIATASGKVGIYGIRMVPHGVDAETYTRASWGGGIHAVFPLPVVSQIIAFTGGLEVVNFLDKKIDLRERVTGLRVEQTTSQNYFRLFAGVQVGGHGNGFIRPHVGANLALILHDFSIDNVVPNDADPNNPLSQKLEQTTRVVFGYDFTIGLDLNFSNTVAIDGGVKYVKSFSVPQQLGSSSTRIYPQYFQIYLGVGVSFDMIN